MLECGLALIAACLPSLSILITRFNARIASRGRLGLQPAQPYRDLSEEMRAFKASSVQANHQAWYYDECITPSLRENEPVLPALHTKDSKDLEIGLGNHN